MVVTDGGEICRPMSAESWKKQALPNDSNTGRRTQSERSHVNTNVGPNFNLPESFSTWKSILFFSSLL